MSCLPLQSSCLLGWCVFTFRPPLSPGAPAPPFPVAVVPLSSFQPRVERPPLGLWYQPRACSQYQEALELDEEMSWKDLMRKNTNINIRYIWSTLNTAFLVSSIFPWLTFISWCSGYCLCLCAGQVQTRSLWWICILHFLFLTSSWCSDRPWVTRSKGRATNSNIFLRDWWELELQRSWMSANWSTGGPWRCSRREQVSHFVHFTVTMFPCAGAHKCYLPLWWGGGCSAFCNHGWLHTGLSSRWSDCWAAVWFPLIGILLFCGFDLNQKERKKKRYHIIEKTENTSSWVSLKIIKSYIIEQEKEQLDLPVPDGCFCCWGWERQMASSGQNQTAAVVWEEWWW